MRHGSSPRFATSASTRRCWRSGCSCWRIRIVRFGVPPFRIELLTSIAGVDFDACRARAVLMEIDGLTVAVISLDDLKINKRAAGRHKDLADLEHLP